MTFLPPSARARLVGLIKRLRCSARWHRRRVDRLKFIPMFEIKRGTLGEPIKVHTANIVLICEQCDGCGQRWEREAARWPVRKSQALGPQRRNGPEHPIFWTVPLP
jgi:hypothetical protein